MELREEPARLGGRVLFIQQQQDAPPGHLGDRARQLGLHCDVVMAGQPPPAPLAGYDLVIPLGSYRSVCDPSVPYLADEARLLREAVDADVPVLGICFGAQLLARALGGDVLPMPEGPEIGWIELDSRDHALVDPGPWLIWHFDMIIPPPGADVVARSPASTQVFTFGPHAGVQFHPEATMWSITRWARTYEAELTRLGMGAGGLTAQSRRIECEARERSYALFDRVLARSRRLCRRHGGF